MKTFDKNKYILVSLIASVTLVLDQVTKYLICKKVPLYSKVEVIPGFFDIIHIRNTGIAFGLFKQIGNDYRVLSLTAVTAVALLLIGYLIFQTRKSQRLETISLSLIFGGAVGNLVDRFRLGEVIDFLDVYWKNYHWPAFNVADAAISVGITLFIMCELFRNKGAAQKKKEPEEADAG